MSWEYKIDTYNRISRAHTSVEADMNGFGKLGWEMVSAAIEPTTMVIVYKRQLPVNMTAEPANKAAKAPVDAKLGKLGKGFTKQG